MPCIVRGPSHQRRGAKILLEEVPDPQRFGVARISEGRLVGIEEKPEVRIVALDALTYAGNLENLSDRTQNPRFRFIRGDICDADVVGPIFAEGLDAVVNFAAESHVDRSILGAKAFIRTNVVGVQVLLDQARQHGGVRFLQVSTDEVYGSLAPTGKFTEESPLVPSSPYSASKAARAYTAMRHESTPAPPRRVGIRSTFVSPCSSSTCFSG